MQVRRRVLDVKVLVLTRPALRGEHAASVDIFEISKGKLIVSLGINGLLVVNSQIPFAIFPKTMEAKELIFLLCGGPVLTPRIPFVEDKSSFAYEPFGMVIGSLVERDGHSYPPFESLEMQIYICALSEHVWF